MTSDSRGKQMVDERDKARARLGLAPLPAGKTDSSASVDERTQIRARLGLPPLSSTPAAVPTTLAPVVPTTLAPVVPTTAAPVTKYTAADGTEFTDLATYEKYQALLGEKADIADTKKRAGESAYALLYQEFAQYGLGALVEPLQSYIQEGLSPAEFTLRLRETPAYKKRFAANAQRVAKGLGALSEAEYIGLEDQYQNIMRNYGLPASYYEKGDLGVQVGFEKFLANDVSAAELEDRIVTAQKRVINSNPEVAAALKQFYPDITNGDILAYTLDPTQGLEAIKRKVTAAEIGGAAMAQGLGTGVARAEELASYGVDKRQAQEGFEAVAGIAPRGGQLAAIYQQDPYTQATAETEVFSLGGSAEARKKREKISGLERATFGGQSGLTQGALSRDRAGAF